jgi:hypothetical protein
MTNDGTRQGTTDATPNTDTRRELPQSFGVVAHIWSRQRAPFDSESISAAEGDGPEPID